MSKAEQAADEWAAAFFRAVPADRKKRVKEGEWAAALERFHRDARTIRQRLSLGVLARARSALLLQRRLIAGGFPPDIVRKLVFTLLLNAFAGKE
jgi:hypothetical protein